MRTNIEIDDALLADAMKVSGLTTKKATVEEGLRRLIQLERQVEAVEGMRGLGWEGDLDEMRRGWAPRDWGFEESDGTDTPEKP